MNTLGQRIRIRRDELKMSQEELANEIGTHQNQISRYERGENNPTEDVLKNIAKALKTSPQWLMGMDSDDLSPEEQLIVALYREKAPYLQDKLIEIAKIL